MKERCPHGSEVPEERCLDSTRALVKHDRTIWNDSSNGGALNVYSWSDTPCGCFIWSSLEENLYWLNFDQGNAGCSKEDDYTFFGTRRNGQVVCYAPPPCFLLTCEA